MKLKKCKVCEEIKTADKFAKDSRKCLVCFSEWNRKRSAESYLRTRNEYLTRRRKLYKEHREKVLSHYGAFCNCCGETEEMFLTIDHVNNDGFEHRKGKGGSSHNNIYTWLVRKEYPTGFQVLCRNCNEGKNRNGGICPHMSRRFNDQIRAKRLEAQSIS